MSVFERLAKGRLENNKLQFPVGAKLVHVVNRIEDKRFPQRKVNQDLVDKALG